MPRVLREDEQKMVLDKIKELNETKRSAMYASFLASAPAGQEEYYEKLVELFKEKESLNDQRDVVENAAFLRFVPVNQSSPLTDARAMEVAKSLVKMGYIKKLDLVSKFSSEAREEGEVDTVSDMSKAISGKEKKKASVIEKAKKLKEVFQEKIAFVEREIEEIDKNIERLEKQIEDINKQILMLNSPQAIQTTRDIGGGEKIITTNSDSSDQIEAKALALESQRTSIELQITTLKSTKSMKTAEKENLKLQFESIVSKINEELAKKGLSLEQTAKPKDSKTPEAEPEKTAIPAMSNRPSTEKERRKQTKDKAKDMMYGFNESLTKQEILDHIERGRLDHFVEAKRKLTNSKDVKIFDEKLKQILEDMAEKDRQVVDGKIDVKGIKIKLAGDRGDLTEEEIKAISERVDELFSKKSLTNKERKELDYLQILSLLNLKSMSFRISKMLPFGLNKKMMVRGEDLVMKIGHAARARAIKDEKDRKFLNEVLVARGEKPLSLNRDSDPTTARYDRSDDIVSRIGSDSKYNEK